MLEDLHIGVEVHGSDDARLGTLTRVVIASGDSRVTHLVVDPGLVESGHLLEPGGWEQPRERVVPIALLTRAGRDGIRLSCDRAAFLQLPLFETKQYTAADTTAASGAQQEGLSRFQLGELVNYVASSWGLGAAPYVAPADISLNEAPGSTTIEEGARVWRVKPHEEIGHVHRVLVDPQSQRIQALVVHRRGLVGRQVVLPITYVQDVDEDVVHITISDQDLDHLAPYRDED
jgi:sporulation protein YlmC with PRC-barrel domain